MAMNIDLEIYQGNGGQLVRSQSKNDMSYFAKEGICSWMYKGNGSNSYHVGTRFVLPDEAGKLCPWLLFTVQPFVQVLACRGTLPWKYEGTPYQKIIDEKGVTTEFVRCPDPTSSGIVVKITRRIIS